VFSLVLSETTEEFFLPYVIILLSQHVGVNFNHNRCIDSPLGCVPQRLRATVPFGP